MHKSIFLIALCLLLAPGIAAGQTDEDAEDGSSEAEAEPDLDEGEDEVETDAESADIPDDGGGRYREWELQLGLGANFVVFLDWASGVGPDLKFAAIKHGWNGHFMIGGGPSFQYSGFIATDSSEDEIHGLTVNGDFVIGGGTYEKFAVYFHAVLGLGAASAYDGATDDKFWTFWARAGAGVGGYVYLAPFVSLGALVDVGFPGTIDAMLTVGFHLGKEVVE